MVVVVVACNVAGGVNSDNGVAVAADVVVVD